LRPVKLLFLMLAFWSRLALPSAHGQELNAPLAPSFWFKGGVGFGFSAQTDAQTSAAGWRTLFQTAGWTDANAIATHALQTGRVEIGMGFDPRNGVAFDFTFLQGPEYIANASIPLAGFYTSIHGVLQAFGFELAYYRFWPDDQGRFYLKAGAAYYSALVGYSYSFDYGLAGSGVGMGELGGEGWGGTLEVGREWRLGRDWGLGVFYRERCAVIPRIRQDNVPFTDGTTGNLGLAVDPTGNIITDDPANIGQDGNRWAVVDFTGFDAGLTFDLYLF